jgi:acyl-coenzyme A synthetase/AMP-(fatty) acid ligase
VADRGRVRGADHVHVTHRDTGPEKAGHRVHEKARFVVAALSLSRRRALDEPTAHWAADALGVPIVDNYWQTESGWPILSRNPASKKHRANSEARRSPLAATT